MEPHDLDQLVNEEAELLGLPPEIGRRDPTLPDDPLGASLGEILEHAQSGRLMDSGQEALPVPGQDGRIGPPDLEAPAREIEMAIDALRPRHPYDLPMRPEYMFDRDYMPDRSVLILGWSMPAPLFGPYPDW